MNLLMMAPLRDSRGKIRYFIGAQVDVSGLVKDCTDLDCLQQLVRKTEEKQPQASNEEDAKDDFRGLSEMFNMAELETVRKYGGRMHKEYQEDEPESSNISTLQMPRLLLQDSNGAEDHPSHMQRNSGKLSGIYQNVSTIGIAVRSLLIIFSISSSVHILLSASCLLLRRFAYPAYSSLLSWTRWAGRIESEMSFLQRLPRVVVSLPRFDGCQGWMKMGETGGFIVRH